MKVLVACEFSGTVREAFRAKGHDAWSCDILPAEDRSRFHFQDDVLALLPDKVNEAARPIGNKSWLDWPDGQCGALYGGWDLMIAFPPCTHLCVSGARWFKDKKNEQRIALAFVRSLMAAPIKRIALENPIGIISSRVRKPDQIIQPWQFGHGETKATCLWLKGLPKLAPTNIVEGRTARVHKMPPGPNRWRERSRTFQGIADAMAAQWT